MASQGRPKPRARAVAVAHALSVLVTAGCGGTSTREPDSGPQALAAATGEPEIRRLTVGALPITDLKQLFVAEAKGFFQEDGLEVEVQHFEGGAAIIPAVVSGSVDVGFSNEQDLQGQIELSHEYGLLPHTFDANEVLAR
jgi:NitT/TauT family transport system substrate-binding protein